MKYLTESEFFGESVNKKFTGMSYESEFRRKRECLAFLRKLKQDLGFSDKIMCISAIIFSIFVRKVPYSKF